MEDFNSIDMSAVENGYAESADGTLVIMVCRAKHLPNRRKLDKQSPYVTLRIGTTAKKTQAAFRAGQTPEWTQEVRFQLTRERKPVMKLDVLDETKNEPTPIGTIDIDCSVIFKYPENRQEGKYIHDKWYDLSLNGRRAGMIYLEMTFYPSAPVLPPKIGFEQSQSSYVDGRSSIGSHQLGHSLLHSLVNSPPKHPNQGKPKTAADEVFVTSGSEKLKRLSFFKSTASASGTPLTSSQGSAEEPSKEETTGTKKYTRHFANLKSRFQSKEPIHSLWATNNEETDLNDDPEPYPKLHSRSISPISAYDPDDINHLEKEIQSPYFQSPRPHDARDEIDVDGPLPPPHLVDEDDRILGTGRLSHYNSPFPPSPPAKEQRKSPSRKPPPASDFNSAFSSMNINATPKSNTSVPFSADTIGLDDLDGPLPTKVYCLGKPVKSLSHSGLAIPEDDAHRLNPDEIDPRYYAPTPTEHLAQTMRLQSGQVSRQDVSVDLNTGRTGYLGDGKWDKPLPHIKPNEGKFSPSVFDRINDENTGYENKPNIPPKIPQGLTEMEYYVLEKDKYLKDINGRRF